MEPGLAYGRLPDTTRQKFQGAPVSLLVKRFFVRGPVARVYGVALDVDGPVVDPSPVDYDVSVPSLPVDPRAPGVRILGVETWGGRSRGEGPRTASGGRVSDSGSTPTSVPGLHQSHPVPRMSVPPRPPRRETSSWGGG